MNKIFILHFFAFLIGSIPFGYLLGKIQGVDIRKAGSGNIGSTNVMRLLGKKQGYLTLLADISKGLVAVFLAQLVPETTEVLTSDSYAATLGLAAIIGHCYSPFLKFNGGKGVATSLGVFIGLSPLHALVALVVFLISLKLCNYVSLSSIIAAAALPISFLLVSNNNGVITTVAAITAGIIVSRHKTNIYRLSEGKEPKTMLSQERQEQSAT